MDDFGDTRQGDLAGSRADPGSSEAKMDVWWGLLSVVAQNLERLEIGLAAVREEISRLEAAGMYPAVPSESWESRNGGEARYLRMVFPVGTLAVRRKEYVGREPEAIAEARRLAANRRRWEELGRAVAGLERFLVVTTGVSLRQIASRVAEYRVPDVREPQSNDLGTVGAGHVASGDPKEEADD